MRNYVVGFMFSENKKQVLLIEKKHPEWQNGSLNGIGGKEEGDETMHETMVREFEEETGLITDTTDWEHFCNITAPNNWCVACFRAVGDITQARTTTDEPVHIVDSVLTDLNGRSYGRLRNGWIIKTLDSLKWLLPMALIDDIVIGNVEYKETAP